MNPLRISLISLLVTASVGCASTAETDYATQANQQTNQISSALLETLAANNPQQTSEQAPLQLTDLVDLPELDQYLQTALANNPGLQQSMIALKMAYAQQGITSSGQLPSVNAGFKGQAQENSDTTYTTDLTVSWELDLWQKLADSSEAAAKDIAASHASLQGTRDLLAANIMRSWLEVSLNQQLLEIESRRLEVLENNEALVLERYQAGLGSLKELDNARTSSATTRSTLAKYHENLAQSQRSLALLSGQWSEETEQPQIEASFPEVLSPLDAMPEQDLARRPDLQQAFYNIEAESLRTDAAYKAMLPSISLSASLTDIATSPSEALLSDPLWSVLGQLTAPLFQGGKLKSQAELAELTTEKQFWAYQETLLNAVNEVENAVGQEASLAKQQAHLTDALQSAQRSFTTYKEQYRQGLIDIFDLLTVQQQTYDTEAQLVNATYLRLKNRIDLGLALGLGVSS